MRPPDVVSWPRARSRAITDKLFVAYSSVPRRRRLSTFTHSTSPHRTIYYDLSFFHFRTKKHSIIFLFPTQ